MQIPRDDLRKRAEPHLREVMSNLYTSLFQQSPLLLAVHDLGELVGSSAQPPAGGQDWAVPLLTRVGELLTTIDGELSAPAYQWLARDDAALGPEVGDSLTSLARLSFISADFIETLREEGRRQMAAARATLLNARDLTGRPFFVSKDGRPALDEHPRALKAAIEELFQQPFAMAVRNRSAARLGAMAGTRLAWDPQTLREALNGTQTYLASATQQAGQLSPPSRRVVHAAQQELLSRYVDDLVAKAAQSGAGDGGWSVGYAGLRSEVQNFAASAPLLAALRDNLNILGFADAADRVRDVTGAQAARLLRETDERLSAEAPYRPLDPAFLDWTGSGPLAEPAFGATSVADLAMVLAMRREFVERLAQDYAQPSVEYLDSASSGRAADDWLVAKWKLIIRALQRYQQREPGNSIERLEHFIVAGMDQLDLGNCLTETAGREQTGDYFGEQLVLLRQAVGARCTVLNRADIEARYGKLRSAFNKDLAGRFPFVGIGGGAEPLTDSGRLADADPNDVRHFFLGFEGEIAALPPRLRDSRLFADGGRNAAAFLDQLARVRVALAPMLADPALSAPLSYEVATEFRTNSERDSGGDQILQWGFTVNDQRARPSAGPVIWTQGDPVAVSLRWARNAPQVPVPPEVGLPKVNDVTATFRFTGPWALLSLIAVQAPPRAWALALSDRRPEVLSFSVPLKSNPQAAPGGQEVERADVYMRLGLTAITKPPGQPERRDAVALPFFPPSAPQIGGEGGRVLGGVQRGVDG